MIVTLLLLNRLEPVVKPAASVCVLSKLVHPSGKVTTSLALSELLLFI